jgi:hypothetical protein
MNGKPNAKTSRHINIRYFWLKDLVQRKQVSVTYISTTIMIADALTKSLSGPLFRIYRDAILGKILFSDISPPLQSTSVTRSAD